MLDWEVISTIKSKVIIFLFLIEAVTLKFESFGRCHLCRCHYYSLSRRSFEDFLDFAGLGPFKWSFRLPPFVNCTSRLTKWICTKYVNFIWHIVIEHIWEHILSKFGAYLENMSKVIVFYEKEKLKASNRCQANDSQKRHFLLDLSLWKY